MNLNFKTLESRGDKGVNFSTFKANFLVGGLGGLIGDLWLSSRSLPPVGSLLTLRPATLSSRWDDGASVSEIDTAPLTRSSWLRRTPVKPADPGLSRLMWSALLGGWVCSAIEPQKRAVTTETSDGPLCAFGWVHVTLRSVGKKQRFLWREKAWQNGKHKKCYSPRGWKAEPQKCA